MNILLVNWQDRLNPQAGGAEIHLHETFGRLAAAGHQVTLLASAWPGARTREEVDGIEVHRTGTRHTFGLRAPRYYRQHLAGRGFGGVVDALNKVPSYAPVWAASPVVLLVHHLFGTTAFQQAPVVLAAATWLLERPLARYYADIPVQAISHSTADDLVARGMDHRHIRVIYPGVDAEFFNPGASQRAAEPVFVYLGRLQRYKRVDLVVQAFARLRARGLSATLIIAGRGDHERALRGLADALGVAEHVQFRGFVTEDEKRDLFRAAWANVFTSPKEGWGITSLEAAACGTPTVASNAPGLRESVRHGETGLLVAHGDVDALADALASLALQPDRVAALGRSARRFAESFTWDRTAAETEQHLCQVLETAQGAAV